MGLGLGLKAKARRAKNEFSFLIANKVGRPDLFNLKSRERIGAVYTQPSDMCEADKIMLYALIRGLRPLRVLEIGVRWGGGARIISAALEDAGAGYAVGIDPETSAFRPKNGDLLGRYQLLEGYSPQAIPEAISKLGGHADFVLIDAMHTHDHVLADFTGVIPHLSAFSHVLLHDTYHAGINAAIKTILDANPSFVDCGFLTRHPDISNGVPVAYQGLRLIRTSRLQPERLIQDGFAEHGREADLSPAIHNWDAHWNRIKAGG